MQIHKIYKQTSAIDCKSYELDKSIQIEFNSEHNHATCYPTKDRSTRQNRLY